MGFVILLIIGIISMIVFEPLAKITKVPVVLFFILFGILFAQYGIYDLFSQIEGIDQNITELSILSTYAVMILFLVSGLGLNMKAIKSSGTTTLVLSTLPVLVEGIVLGIISWAIFTILPIDTFSFSIWGFILVMCVFAMAAPAIVIPITMKAQANGKESKIFDQMSVASVLDNFTPFPLIVILVILATSVGIGESSGSILSTIGIVFGVVIAIIIAYILGHLFGYLIGLFQNKVKIPPIVMSLILIIGTLVLVEVTGPLGATLGLMIALGVGIGFNTKVEASPIKAKITQGTTKIYNLALMPLIFIYVGTQVQINLLLKPTLVILMAVITVLAIAVKSMISKKYLKSKGYNNEEATLSGALFASKGTILINFSLILGSILKNAGLNDVLQYMYILAAVSIIISIPYCIIKSEKIIEKM